MIYLADSCLQNECFLKPITKTFVKVSCPRGAPSALLPLTPYYWGCKKQLKAPPVSAFPLPPLLGNWKPLSIGAGVGPHLQLISHTDAPFGLQNETKCWTLRPIVLLVFSGRTEWGVRLCNQIFSTYPTTSLYTWMLCNRVLNHWLYYKPQFKWW